MTSIYDEMLSVEHRALGRSLLEDQDCNVQWPQLGSDDSAATGVFVLSRLHLPTLYKDRPQKYSLAPLRANPWLWKQISYRTCDWPFCLAEILPSTWPRDQGAFHGTRLPGYRGGMFGAALWQKKH
jgi:hypothetical protein